MKLVSRVVSRAHQNPAVLPLARRIYQPERRISNPYHREQDHLPAKTSIHAETASQKPDHLVSVSSILRKVRTRRILFSYMVLEELAA
jgi:hypothetical protein